MIERIIEVLDAVAGARLGAATRHGLVWLQPVENGTAPAKYIGGSSWKIVSVDSGGDWSYWRLPEKVKEYPNTQITACDLLTQEQSLRLVTLVSRELCDPLTDVARAAASDMRRAARTLRTAVSASLVEITINGIDVDTNRVFATEFAGTGIAVNPDKALVAIDLVVKVTGKEVCFDVCGTPLDVLCALIAAASNSKVEECLGEDRIVEICGGGVACPYDGIIQINGIQVGTFGPFDPCVPNTLNIVLE